MLRYHAAFYLPHAAGEMVVAEALDFPGAVTQGFDLQDARLMIASALEDLAQSLLRRSDRTGATVSSRWNLSEVKRHELIDHLRRHGCRLEREGGRHMIFTNPINRAKVRAAS
jgi:predicted RNase H-like HicB family nuclease